MTKPDNWLAQLKAEYPKRSKGKNYDWPRASDHILKYMKVYGFEAILEGTKAFCAASKICGDYGTEFIPMASTFYNQRRFLDEYETEDVVAEVQYRQPEQLTESQRRIDADKAEADFRRLRSVG